MYETKSKKIHGHKVYYSVGPSTECKVTKPYDRINFLLIERSGKIEESWESVLKLCLGKEKVYSQKMLRILQQICIKKDDASRKSNAN